MIVTTTNTVEGRQIVEYLGSVTGEIIMGANFVRDLMGSVIDFIGGRSGTYEPKLRDGRQTAMQEMTEEAHRMGTDAIVGSDIDDEVVGSPGSMLMVSVSGTAVRLG